MTVLGIRIVGDPILRTRADEVTEFGPVLRKLVADMDETMENVEGAGLAAPQVGVSLRVFTYQIAGQRGHIINPVLELSDDDQDDISEGCLSIPGLGYPVTRRRWTRATGVDVDNNPVVIEGEGFLARCLQHETDHLDGILYIDRLIGDLKKEAFRKLRNTNYNSVAATTVNQRSAALGSSFGAGASFGGQA
ncbi:peptide deformylase [Paeniglutamicibacter kerguelensis]|uniref:Peptide deformylase n=1 Tax=Paeniglutamicibacter kerguelensis TaxID=254788 RepID=A0ABS4XE80_9MICC|nr:peptide deformylase [Paeniglutamicibacter kerguelensis]MBP2386543.1 peptide deformylase [Paeniglutamicibacter kerguelensis]